MTNDVNLSEPIEMYKHLDEQLRKAKYMGYMLDGSGNYEIEVANGDRFIVGPDHIVFSPSDCLPGRAYVREWIVRNRV
jgi:hypothetical protein